MRHPLGRAHRRFNGEAWRNRQRRIMLTWYGYRRGSGHPLLDPTDNNMWWGRKKTYGHGNRCMCHCEKRDRKEIRKRRRRLTAQIGYNLESYHEEPECQG